VLGVSVLELEESSSDEEFPPEEVSSLEEFPSDDELPDSESFTSEEFVGASEEDVPEDESSLCVQAVLIPIHAHDIARHIIKIISFFLLIVSPFYPYLIFLFF
jgi:hypothetical protein